MSLVHYSNHSGEMGPTMPFFSTHVVEEKLNLNVEVIRMTGAFRLSK